MVADVEMFVSTDTKALRVALKDKLCKFYINFNLMYK
jgi:hypothetical protein